MVRFVTCTVVSQRNSKRLDNAHEFSDAAVRAIDRMCSTSPPVTGGLQIVFSSVISGRMDVTFDGKRVEEMGLAHVVTNLQQISRDCFMQYMKYGFCLVKLNAKGVANCLDLMLVKVHVAVNKEGRFDYFVEEKYPNQSHLRRTDEVMCFEVHAPVLRELHRQSMSKQMHGLFSLFTPTTREVVAEPGCPLWTLRKTHHFHDSLMESTVWVSRRAAFPAVAVQQNSDVSKDANNMISHYSPNDMFDGRLSSDARVRSVTAENFRQMRAVQDTVNDGITDSAKRMAVLGDAIENDEMAEPAMQLNDHGALQTPVHLLGSSLHIPVTIVPTDHAILTLPEAKMAIDPSIAYNMFLKEIALVLGIPMGMLGSSTELRKSQADSSETRLHETSDLHTSILKYILSVVTLAANNDDLVMEWLKSSSFRDVAPRESVSIGAPPEARLVIDFPSGACDFETLIRLNDMGLMRWDFFKRMMGARLGVDPRVAFVKDKPLPEQEEQTKKRKGTS